MGLGILGACAAALPLVGILTWRGSPALGTAIIALTIGAGAGLVWGIVTRPTLLSAALEADRQLGWADLLSSATILGAASANDPWAGAVRAAADVRCRGVSPGTVVLHQLGARAWGGIGLATALVLVLGMLPIYAAPMRAGEQGDAGGSSLAGLEGNPAQSNAGDVSNTRRTPVQEDPEDSRANRMTDANQPPAQAGKAQSSPDAGRGKTTHAVDPNGHGTGASQSKTANPLERNAITTGTQARNSSPDGKPSGGAGLASPRHTGEGKDAGQGAGESGTAARPTPPWQSPSWAADSQKARAAVEAGSVPDSYRDVIRGYFDPS